MVVVFPARPAACDTTNARDALWPHEPHYREQAMARINAKARRLPDSRLSALAVVEMLLDNFLANSD
jgi:hypothetical protein